MRGWVLALLSMGVVLQGCGGGGDSTGAAMVYTGKAVPSEAAQPAAGEEPTAPGKDGTTLAAAQQGVNKPLAVQGRLVNLGIAEATPTSINAELYVGNKMPDVQFRGKFVGDFSLLPPRPITLKVQDPDKLFTDQALLSYSTVQPTPWAAVLLMGQVQATAGTLAGKVGITACLDIGCQQVFLGSPYAIPYNVRVLRGIRLSQDAVTLRSNFGAAPPSTTLVVTPPEGAPASSLNVLNDPYGSTIRGTLTDTGDGTARLTLTTQAALPAGNFSAVLWVLSNAQSRSGFTAPARMLTVNHVVDYDPSVLYLVNPANVLSVLAVPAGVPPEQFRSAYFEIQAGASNQSLTYDGADLVPTPATTAMPPEARAGLLMLTPSATPPAGPTYRLSQRVEWSSCGYDQNHALHCLPVGRHPFTIRYTHRAWNGSATPIQISGELVVGN